MMQKKAEVKSPVVKATEVKEADKKTEEKLPIVKALEAKAVEVKNVIEKKMETKPEQVKAESKAEVKKEAPKKAEKKVAAKKEKVEKTEILTEVTVQFGSQEANVADVVERVKALYVAEGHRESSIKSLQVYLKPEEQAAYYVINKKASGRVDMF